MIRSLAKLVLCVCVLILFIGCGEGKRAAVISVPQEFENAYTSLFDAADDVDKIVEVVSRHDDAELGEAFADADVIVGWWSAEFQEAIIRTERYVDLGEYGTEAVYPTAAVDFLAISTDEGRRRHFALPVCIDPWLMIWREDYLLSRGGRAEGIPQYWDDVVPGEVVFAVPGKAVDARLTWAALLEQSYPQIDQTHLWSGGFKKLASFQIEGLFQRGAFSYSWPDAQALLISGAADGMYMPASRFRLLEPKHQATLVPSRPPVAAGSRTYTICGALLVAVPTSRRGSEERAASILKALSGPGEQRSIADDVGAVAARMDGRLRDGFDQAARRAVRNATALYLPPDLGFPAGEQDLLADLSEKIMRSPAEVEFLLE